MPQKCKVCMHPKVDEINDRIVSKVPLETISKAYTLTISSVNRHKQNHIPVQLAKAQESKEVAAADSLMGRVSALSAKAEDIYARSHAENDLTTALQAVRELRGITELYAKITGELQAQTVTNIIISSEWMTLRSVILNALEPYPEARQAVLEAVRRLE